MPDLPLFKPNMSLEGYAHYVRDYSMAVIPHIEWSAHAAGEVLEIMGVYPSGGDAPDRTLMRTLDAASLAAGAREAVQQALEELETELVPPNQRPGRPVFER